MKPQIKWVLLYRTSRCWRISVAEEAGEIGCGALPDTAPEAPAEIAQQDMLDHLRRYWNFTGKLVWHETEPGHWAAEPAEPCGGAAAGRSVTRTNDIGEPAASIGTKETEDRLPADPPS